MIVIGTDPHKQTHTAAALDAQTAERLDELTAQARDAGHDRLLAWARALDEERVWAIEDCRHVSGGLERFLLRSGERVVRVAPKLMAGARKSARDFGKSDALAGVERFASDAKLAKLAGVAPLDASSGKQQRHRLNRKGNRQLNLALHRIAITQARIHVPAKDYLARREAEGKTAKEALRALKRHLARRVHRLLSTSPAQHDRRTRIQLNAAISVPCLT